MKVYKFPKKIKTYFNNLKRTYYHQKKNELIKMYKFS